MIIGLGLTALTGCGVARGAPSRNELVTSATADADFSVEVVTRDRLATFRAWGGASARPQSAWPTSSGEPAEQRLAPGDRLSLRIWDAEESSLITPPDARFSDVSNVVVSAAGTVTLPYTGDVRVAGLTLGDARLALQESLSGIIPSAQVQMAVEQGRRNSVALLGGVATPGTYPLTERSLPLTNLIARAGGARQTLVNPQVQITRGVHVYRRPLSFVMASPANDPALIGGDRVLIEEDPRTFMALGATGRQAVIVFDDDTVTALRAMSMMGGVVDSRADPRGILILRQYPEAAVRLPNGPPNTRVVFSFDLTDADSLFSANEFALQDQDLVLATLAPATTAHRVLSLFGTVLGIADRASDL